MQSFTKFEFLIKNISGNLKLLVSHPVRNSATSSDVSSRSAFSYSSSSLTPSQLNPIYDEIVAPSGYKVGEAKCVVLRKVCSI